LKEYFLNVILLVSLEEMSISKLCREVIMKKVLFSLMIISMILSQSGCSSSGPAKVKRAKHAKVETVKKLAPESSRSGEGMLLAVMDFTGDGVSMNLASQTSEMLRNTFINKGGYTIVERSQMDQILKEQGFQMSGCTDTSCAVEIGKLLSAKKILIGKVMKVGNSIIISGRIVDVEKGVGEAASTAKAASEDDLFNAVNEFVNNIK
jgi:curli biogenesis system outer membrane secretion channel CsgG